MTGLHTSQTSVRTARRHNDTLTSVCRLPYCARNAVLNRRSGTAGKCVRGLCRVIDRLLSYEVSISLPYVT